MDTEAARALPEAEAKQEEDYAAFRDHTRGAERSNLAQSALGDPQQEYNCRLSSFGTANRETRFAG
jgi:hypothetical protein